MDDIAGCCLLIILIPIGLFITFVGLAVCAFAWEASSGQFLPYFIGGSIILLGLALSIGPIVLLYIIFKEA